MKFVKSLQKMVTSILLAGLVVSLVPWGAPLARAKYGGGNG